MKRSHPLSLSDRHSTAAGLAAAIAAIATMSVAILCACSDGNNHTGRLGADRLRPVPADGLVAFKPVYFSVKGDTVRNCDTASEYKLLARNKPADEDGKSEFHYDAFTGNGAKIGLFTFQRFSGDSLFMIATINKGGPDNFYSGVCIEKKDILRTFMLSESTTAHAKTNGQHPMSRRRPPGGTGHR
jgi:hypothetical protein